MLGIFISPEFTQLSCHCECPQVEREKWFLGVTHCLPSQYPTDPGQITDQDAFFSPVIVVGAQTKCFICACLEKPSVKRNFN